MNKFQILIFGASSTHGNWDEMGGWAERIRRAVIKKVIDAPDKYHGHVFNLGVPGDSTGTLLVRMDGEIKARLFYSETTIIISVGGNDSRVYVNNKKPLVTDEQFKNNWNTILEIAKAHAKQVISIGLTPVDEKRTDPFDGQFSYLNERIARFNLIIKECCVANAVLFVDICPVSLFDGLHPDTQGHIKIFDLVEGIIAL